MNKSVVIPMIFGMMLLSGCGQYDVLQKTADMETVGELHKDLENDGVSEEQIGLVDDLDIHAERPTYQVSDYVDTNACVLPEHVVQECPKPTENEALEAIQALMREKEIYSVAKIVGENDIVNIDYTATETGKTEAYVDVTDQDTDVKNFIFPDDINAMLLNAKVGDVIEAEYVYPDDYFDMEYRGKTFVYHITINAIKGMNVTDEVAMELSSGAAKTAKDYISYVTSVLYLQRQDAALNDAVDQLFRQCRIKGYPEDVLEYDIRTTVLAAYDNAGMTDATVENFESGVLKDMGYKNMDAFLEDLNKSVKENLKTELKTIALAEKYGIDPEGLDVTQIREELKEKIHEEG